VLQLAAGRLGADTVSTNEYRVEREKVLVVDRARWLHGRDLLLPTAEQITVATGSWEEALRIAGLRPPRNVGPKQKRPNAPPLADLMERFYDAHGVQPTRPALQEWASASNIPYPSPKGRNAYHNAREEWIERRRDHWDHDSCVAAVARYIAQLPPGKRFTSRDYRVWGAQQEHAPPMTTIQNYCKSWEAARRDALARVS
jgi:hypothetical protein